MTTKTAAQTEIADRPIEIVKNEARAVADELRTLGYDVFISYGHDHGLTEWDVYEAGNGTLAGLVGSVWYDACGVILKGDRLQALAAGGKLATWPMDR